MKNFSKISTLFALLTIVFLFVSCQKESLESMDKLALTEQMPTAELLAELPTDLTAKDLMATARNTSRGLDLDDKVFYIKAVHSDKYLDIEGNSTQAKANVQQYPYHGRTNQQFQMINAGDGTYFIKSIRSNQYLDIEGNSTKAKANVQQYPFHGRDNQRFYMIEIGNNSYYIVNKRSELLLDIAGASTASKANLQQFTYNNGKNQQFELVPMEEPCEDFSAYALGNFVPNSNKWHKKYNARFEPQIQPTTLGKSLRIQAKRNHTKANQPHAIYNIGETKRGQVTMTMKVKVAANANGAINLQKFSTPGLEESVDIKLRSRGRIALLLNGKEYQSTKRYTTDKWITLKLDIDFITGFGSLYIEEDKIAYWKVSAQEDYSYEGASSFAGVYFKPYSTISDFLVDDICTEVSNDSTFDPYTSIDGFDVLYLE